MSQLISPDPITLAEVSRYLQELLTAEKEQRLMRELGAYWQAAVAADRVPLGDAWLQIADLLAGFDKYEPNPQFCDTTQGYYDYFELKRRVGGVLASIAESENS